MTKMRDEKGRYVKSAWLRWDQYAFIAMAVVFACGVLHLVLWPPIVVKQAPNLPARVITVPADPIDWDTVTVRAIPDLVWQEAHDRALLKDVGKELQRVIDRNEQIAQPQFSRH